MIISYPEFYVVPVIMEDNFDVNLTGVREKNEVRESKDYLGYYSSGDSSGEFINEIYL